MNPKPKTGNEATTTTTGTANTKSTESTAKKASAASPVAGDGGQSSSANSDDITNQENRPHNQLNGERTKKTSRKKWVPIAFDVRTSRGGRKERGSGGAEAAPGTATTRTAGGGRTRNRDSVSKDVPGSGESWRGDTERRATSFGKNPRGARPASAVPATTTAGGAPLTNGGPGYRRPHSSRRGPVSGAGAKKVVNGKQPETTLTDLKNGAPLYYVPASYRTDPLEYLKECIRHQM